GPGTRSGPASGHTGALLLRSVAGDSHRIARWSNNTVWPRDEGRRPHVDRELPVKVRRDVNLYLRFYFRRHARRERRESSLYHPFLARVVFGGSQVYGCPLVREFRRSPRRRPIMLAASGEVHASRGRHTTRPVRGNRPA